MARIAPMAQEFVGEQELLVRLDSYGDCFDGLDPRRSLVVGARGGLPVYGRRPDGVLRELIPLTDWSDDRCRVDSTFDQRRRLPGLHFAAGWSDLAAQRSDIDARWPPRPQRWILVHCGNPLASPKSRQTKGKRLTDWLSRTYPKEIPLGKTMKVLRQEFKAATGVEVDLRTISRALGRR
jgi:hypothetical protein